MKYYHATKNNEGEIRQVDLISDNSDISYNCIIYFDDLNCLESNCEIYLDSIDNEWKVRIK